MDSTPAITTRRAGSGSRPRIAAIIPGVPEPRDRGTYQRYAALIALLGRLGDVDCCCLRDRDLPAGAAERFAASVARLHIAPLVLRPWEPLPLQLVRRLPPFVRHWFDPRLVPAIRAFFAGRAYDLVYLGDLVSLPYAQAVGLPLRRSWVDRSRVDVELQRQVDRYAPARRLARRFSDWCRLRLAARYERVAARALAGEIVCCDSDARALRSCVGGDIPVRVIVNGIDRDDFAHDQADLPAEPAALFVGAMDYLPNVDGLLWYVAEAWPAVRARLPTATLAVVGHDPVPRVRALDGRDGVRILGRVEAMPPWYARSRCAVAPIRIGGGTRLKVVECWAARRPLVATPVAVDGLDAVDGDNCLLATDGPGLAAATIRALTDDALARRLRAGADRAAASYTWQAVLAPLEREWRGRCAPAAGLGAA